MSDSDPAAAYERLKIETAGMLNLNVASSSLLENLQVDLVSLLRLQIDDLQGKVLSGEQVDLNRLSTALTMLRQLLPEKALVSTPPPVETRFGPDHRARLRELIERTVLREDPREAELRRDILAREEMAAVIAAGGNVAAATPPPPPEPPPPQRADNVVSLDATARANSTLPPAHYLKDTQPREAWRDGSATGPFPWPLPR